MVKYEVQYSLKLFGELWIGLKSRRETHAKNTKGSLFKSDSVEIVSKKLIQGVGKKLLANWLANLLAKR